MRRSIFSVCLLCAESAASVSPSPDLVGDGRRPETRMSSASWISSSYDMSSSTTFVAGSTMDVPRIHSPKSTAASAVRSLDVIAAGTLVLLGLLPAPRFLLGAWPTGRSCSRHAVHWIWETEFGFSFRMCSDRMLNSESGRLRRHALQSGMPSASGDPPAHRWRSPCFGLSFLFQTYVTGMNPMRQLTDRARTTRPSHQPQGGPTSHRERVWGMRAATAALWESTASRARREREGVRRRTRPSDRPAGACLAFASASPPRGDGDGDLPVLGASSRLHVGAAAQEGDRR